MVDEEEEANRLKLTYRPTGEWWEIVERDDGLWDRHSGRGALIHDVAREPWEQSRARAWIFEQLPRG